MVTRGGIKVFESTLTRGHRTKQGHGLNLSCYAGGYPVSPWGCLPFQPPIIGPLVWKPGPVLEGLACCHLPAWGPRSVPWRFTLSYGLEKLERGLSPRQIWRNAATQTHYPWIEKDHVRERQRKEVVKATYWEARSSNGTLK